MAVRVLALLIPLALALPQLQMSRPRAVVAQDLAASVPSAPEPSWSYETRRLPDTAVTRVVLESPAQEVVRMIDSPAVTTTDDGATASDVTPQVRKAPPRRVAPKHARLASPAKLAKRQANAMPADAGCAPDVHCAPVVVAKVTPVLRRPL